ncbi:MAG: hypothetical protein J7L43_02040 [Candidatus Aenigmarchaeota archaeon]|nr:hypothetical protein [Candidatus Aenigmarchaeota archaeon]
MKIKTKDLAKLLQVSEARIREMKKELGYKKGAVVYTEDVQKFQSIEKKRMSKGGRPRIENPEYYKKAITVLEDQGFITKRKLLKIFETTKITSIEDYFEKEGNGLYDEQRILAPGEQRKIKYARKIEIIYKLREVVFNKWREENRQNGKYNNGFQGMMIGRNCG